MDATVKIEEMPLTVPLFNHGHSTIVKTDTLVNNVLKKNSAEKASNNKKSPRKQIPTRGRLSVTIYQVVFNNQCLKMISDCS